MAVTIAARKPRVSIVLTVLPETARGGLVGPTESWAQLPEVDPIKNATIVAGPEAIRSKCFDPNMESPFDTRNGSGPTSVWLRKPVPSRGKNKRPFGKACPD